MLYVVFVKVNDEEVSGWGGSPDEAVKSAVRFYFQHRPNRPVDMKLVELIALREMRRKK